MSLIFRRISHRKMLGLEMCLAQRGMIGVLGKVYSKLHRAFVDKVNTLTDFRRSGHHLSHWIVLRAYRIDTLSRMSL